MKTINPDKICLITPDRNDRREFLEHCKWQMQRQTVKAGAHFVINHDAIPGVIDLVPRIKKGIAMAKNHEYDYCLIIENDDYYPDTYIENMLMVLEHADIAGIFQSTYYSIQQPSYRTLVHPGRSSLYCTGFKISAFNNFQWPDDNTLYFDIVLWKHNCLKKFLTNVEMPIGIKHGKGFCPGNFHNGISNGKPMHSMQDDGDMQWLKNNVRSESFELYKKMINHAQKSN